ncbi:MAG: phytanoyl-CoA dioxygenase family protein [Gammaproteobacteria bacterium]|nr:phytanoyl-CoA dioxygenase family protein [Gammaproteobacteria bacterium]
MRDQHKGNCELDELRVSGTCNVGWCSNTPINETMDSEGIPSLQRVGFAALDPNAPPHRSVDNPEVETLRQFLKENNGIAGLEICQPHELDRIARIFYRDGFVVVDNLLDSIQLSTWREGCSAVLRDILVHKGHEGRKYITETNRLPHRYSYGTASASRQQLHRWEWASMVDLPTTTPILKKLFGSADYYVWGSGGDLCLPGAVEYQALHSDLQENFQISDARLAQAQKTGIDTGDIDEVEGLDPRLHQLIVQRTPPMITINFLMSDLTWENGPIRQIPGTHLSAGKIPSQSEEPQWMRTSTLVGAKAGAGMFRDNRGWHGATPNLSLEVRALPDVEYSAPWASKRGVHRSMPDEIWQSLSEHGQTITQWTREESDVWPAGAGVMHPIESVRRKAKDIAIESIVSKPS